MVFSCLKLAVKGSKPSQLEHDIKGLGWQLRAPVPCRCEAAVNTRAGIEKVVRARAVEAKPNEQGQRVKTITSRKNRKGSMGGKAFANQVLKCKG